MSNTYFVQPRKGYTIRHPFQNFRKISPDGEMVEKDIHWHKMANFGDVTISDHAPIVEPVVPVPAPPVPAVSAPKENKQPEKGATEAKS